MTLIGLALAVALAAASSPAADPPATWNDAQSGVYTIDPFHTFATFEYDHFGLSTGRGRFGKTSGEIVVDASGRTARVDITIDARSVSSGVDLLDERLRSKDFFDAEHYPTIRFTSNRFNFTGDALTSVDGNLTIRDVTRPVTLEVQRAKCRKQRNPTLDYPACGADARLVVNRSDYNVSGFIPLVSDRIVIVITVEAIKGAAGIDEQFSRLKPK